MIAAGRNNGFLKRRIVTWAKNIGLRSNMRAMRGLVLGLDGQLDELNYRIVIEEHEPNVAPVENHFLVTVNCICALTVKSCLFFTQIEACV